MENAYFNIMAEEQGRGWEGEEGELKEIGEIDRETNIKRRTDV